MPIRFLTFALGLVGLIAAFGITMGDDTRASEARVSRYGNGQAKEATVFLEGRRHGDTTRYYPDGSLRAQGRFDSGKMVGEWVWMTPDGELDARRSGRYENDVLVAR